MKLLRSLLVILFAALVCGPSAFAGMAPTFMWYSGSAPSAVSSLGMNISANNEEQPFENILKFGGDWWAENSSGSYTGDTDEAVLYANCLDANHYPTTLGTCSGHTHTFTQVSVYGFRSGGAFLPGNYVLLFTAATTTAVNCATNANCINVGFDNAWYGGSVGSACTTAGRCVTTATYAGNGIQTTIKDDDPTSSGNYLTNVALIYSPDSTPSHVGVNEAAFIAAGCMTTINSSACFTPNFISLIPSEFAAIRGMDWRNIIQNQDVNWSDRALATWAFWNEGATPGPGAGSTGLANSNGVPLEALIAACNAGNTNCWINHPCIATSAYVTSEANLVKANLNSNLKSPSEYCNEVWNNGAFLSSLYATMITNGEAALPTTTSSCPDGPYTGNGFAYAFGNGINLAIIEGNIWKSVLGSQAIRVLGSQQGYFGRQTFELGWLAANCGGNGSAYTGTAAANTDAMAVAPYYGGTDPIAWTAQSDGGLTYFFTENDSDSGTLLPDAPVTGNCGNGAGYVCWTAQGQYGVGLTAAGSGYAVNDTITLAGGTFAAATVVTVTGVSSGHITGWYVANGNSGAYTVLPAGFTQGSTSGSGSGATFGPSLGSGGAGYAGGNTITLTGGTFATAAVVTVDTVNGSGTILTFHVSTPGSYTAANVVQPNTLTQGSTSGSGTGASFNWQWGGATFQLTTGLSLSSPANAKCVGISTNISNTQPSTIAVDSVGTLSLNDQFGNSGYGGLLGNGQAYCYTNATAAGSVTPGWDMASQGYPGGWIKQSTDWWACEVQIVAGTTACGNPASPSPVALYAYESGEGFVAGNNTVYENWYYAAMRDARSGTDYTNFYTTLRTGAPKPDALMVFTDIGPFSQYGTWTVLENISQTSSSRYNATAAFHN